MLRTKYVTRDQKTHLYLAGPMDEKAAKVLHDILPHMGKQVTIDFSEVEYFNSLGLRTWVNFLRSLIDGRQVAYEQCTIDLMQQINMMPMISKGVEVVSFLASFACDNCGHEQKALMQVKMGKEALLKLMDEQQCGQCQATMVSEEDPQTILFFLQS